MLKNLQNIRHSARKLMSTIQKKTTEKLNKSNLNNKIKLLKQGQEVTLMKPKFNMCCFHSLQ